MSLRSTAVTSRAAAERWWQDLAQYVMCQSVAESTGLWPLHNGLDHGQAGYFHAQALQIAERLGITEEYFAVHDNQVTGFSASTREMFRQSSLFQRLLAHERDRRAAIARYEFAAGTSGVVCCGSMRNCPYLRSVDAPVGPVTQTLREHLLGSSALDVIVRQAASPLIAS